MPKAKAGGKVSPAVKKGAIALASLAGLALMAKHRDKLPGLMAKAGGEVPGKGLWDKVKKVAKVALPVAATVGAAYAGHKLMKGRKGGREDLEWRSYDRGPKRAEKLLSFHDNPNTVPNMDDAWVNEPAGGWNAPTDHRARGLEGQQAGDGLWDTVKNVAGRFLGRKSVMSQAFPGMDSITLGRPAEGWGLSGGTKSLKALKRLGLTGSKKVNSLRHIASNEILDSPEYQQSAVAIHDRLKRLPEKSELKQAAYQAGGMLLGAGVSKRKTHSKRNKLLASSALLTLGTKHNKEITGNSLKILRKQRNRAQEMEAYLKSIPMAKNDFYKDRMELAKQNESQPPVDSTPQQPAPGKGIRKRGNAERWDKAYPELVKKWQETGEKGKGIGNIVGLMSKPRRKGTGIKEKLKRAAKVVLPAAAAAAALYAGHKIANRDVSQAVLNKSAAQSLNTFAKKGIMNRQFSQFSDPDAPGFFTKAVSSAVRGPARPEWMPKKTYLSLDDLIASRM
jgi:hypothetical protein